MAVVATDNRIARRPRWWAELLLVGGGYGLYHLAQIHAPQGAAIRHGWDILGLERAVHVDFELSINRIVAARPWLALPGDFYYATLHFAVTIGVLVWLWWRRPDWYRRARRVIVAGTLIALAIFWLYPAAPPRLLAGSGFIDTNVAYHTIFDVERGSASKAADLYASMPSLHIAWALWCAWALSGGLNHRLARRAVYLYPVLTALVVVGTGNHFFLDLIGGAAVMALGALVGLRLPEMWAELRHHRYRILPGRAWAIAMASLAGPLALLVIVLNERRLAGAGLKAVGHADLLWLVGALAAEAASMAAFAGLHRRALKTAGVGVRRRTATAISFASNAISSSVPLVGSVVGTANTWRQYRRRGAPGTAVTWALAASGVASAVAFTVMMGIGAAASGNRAIISAGAVTTAVGLALTLVVVAGTKLPAVGARLERVAAAVMGSARGRRLSATAADPAAAARKFIEQFRSYRPTFSDVGFAVSAGVLNWAFDVAALALAIRAAGGHLPAADLIVLWTVAATASSVSFTPSGIGVVEPVLAAGLVLAGMPHATAVAATLLYRSVSLLAPVSVGWVVQLSFARVGAAQPIAVPVRSSLAFAVEDLSAVEDRSAATSNALMITSPAPGQASARRQPSTSGFEPSFVRRRDSRSDRWSISVPTIDLRPPQALNRAPAMTVAPEQQEREFCHE